MYSIFLASNFLHIHKFDLVERQNGWFKKMFKSFYLWSFDNISWENQFELQERCHSEWKPLGFVNFECRWVIDGCSRLFTRQSKISLNEIGSPLKWKLKTIECVIWDFFFLEWNAKYQNKRSKWANRIT